MYQIGGRPVPAVGDIIPGPFGPDGYTIQVTRVVVYHQEGTMAVDGIRSDVAIEWVQEVNPTGLVSFLWDVAR